MSGQTACIDVVVPVYNEGASIAATLDEFYQVVARQGAQPVRFVVCEDGSSDDSVAVLQHLQSRLPMLLLSAPGRKGYSQAVIDGLQATTAGWVCFIDSDGQCDPGDLLRLAALRDGKADLIVGWRNPRNDSLTRRGMSGAFKFVYKMFFTVRMRDPSCPYLLINRAGLEKIMAGKVGVLKQGFWWEFLARAVAAKLVIIETPVGHRPRAAGVTQIYRARRIPRIAAEHFLGLYRLRQELDASR